MPRSVQMETVFLALLLGAVGASANQAACPSGQLTTDGVCCLECGPGEGVTKPCGATQTVCDPCLDSETYSEGRSHTERCQPCTRCAGLQRMKSPCMDANDAVCVCDYGFYLSQQSNRCEPCTRCPEGEGLLYSCDYDRDTVCESCSVDNYSDQESSTEPCLPCTLCDEDDEEEIQPCTRIRDTVCQDMNPLLTTPSPTLNPWEVNPPSVDYEDPAGPPPSEEPTTTERPGLVYKGLHDKLIPIYCSILAAVVLGLLAFVIFKRWNSCKQNKQGNSCPSGQGPVQQASPSPEGEKMHSDSGISVDSQSLQEGHSTSQTVVTVDEDPCLLVPLQTREELEVLESLLLDGGPGLELLDGGPGLGEGEWSRLAALLGYAPDQIEGLRQRQQPLRALLGDWAGREGAGRDLLCSALNTMNRPDLAEKLRPAAAKPGGAKSNATSVV
ncbi:nerve growth factor receptor b [Gadus macrocephalus]|uniref:nerve growth factor receptor b n=1 Tax=Gadus macrocephalus TaxID=80720 RepID=UPI0028CB4ECB|nr:nerve growth factor receptor b [Gadus macrocephalus]